MLARFLSLVIALWLMFSVFAWPHSGQEAMTVGLMWAFLLLVLSAAAIVAPPMRWPAGMLGLALAAFSILAPHEARFTRAHDLTLGLVLFALAFVKNEPAGRHHPGLPRHLST